MKCSKCGKKYEADGRGNLCPGCYEKIVPKQFRSKVAKNKPRGINRKAAQG